MERISILVLCLAVGLLLAANCGEASTVSWMGQTWDDTTWGNWNDAATAPGDLIIHQTGIHTGAYLPTGNWYVGEAHYTTNSTFQALAAPSVAVTFNDATSATDGGGGCLSWQGTNYMASIQTEPGQSDLPISGVHKRHVGQLHLSRN
jgi:hypothetical protein